MFQKFASLKYHKNSVSISNLLNVYHIPKATHDSWQINWPQKKRKCEWLHYYCLVHLFGKRMKKKKGFRWQGHLLLFLRTNVGVLQIIKTFGSSRYTVCRQQKGCHISVPYHDLLKWEQIKGFNPKRYGPLGGVLFREMMFVL